MKQKCGGYFGYVFTSLELAKKDRLKATRRIEFLYPVSSIAVYSNECTVVHACQKTLKSVIFHNSINDLINKDNITQLPSSMVIKK